MLEEFLEKNAELLEIDFIVLKLDVEDMENGDQAATKLGHGANSGLPWMTILDSTGDEIVNSDSPQGNIGCPITKKECGYFMTMIEQSKQRLTSQQTSDLATALDAYAAPKRRGNN